MTKDIRSEGVERILTTLIGDKVSITNRLDLPTIAKIAFNLWDNGIRPASGFRVAILKNKEARSSADKPLKQYIVPTEEGGE